MAAPKAKQYLSIANRTILEHTVAVFLAHSQIREIVVVVHPEDQIFDTLSIASHPKVHKIDGGSERVDSVLAGLRFIANHEKNVQHSELLSTSQTLQKNSIPGSFVLVHDAARPCVNTHDITKLITECMNIKPQDNIAGAILACPVADTIKEAMTQNNAADAHSTIPTIAKTIDRSLLWQAQTPQMFGITELLAAIETGLSKGIALTDEASAMENVGKHVMLVEGPSSNLKITRQSDLALANFYLSTHNSASA
jgi:2-C-methyl-D-erythritol 4-phosphate cytidylyltransferase